MVSISATSLTTVVSNQALKLLGDAAASGNSVQRVINSPGFRSSESTVGSAALAKIQELTQSTGGSAEDAVARVKGWVKSGLASDAAAGRNDAWLGQMAAEDKLGDLPPLTQEQEKKLSIEEARVYSQARQWQAMYSGPRTLADAQTAYASSMIPGMEKGIAELSERLKNGAVPEEFREANQQNVDEMKAKVDAFKASRFRFIQIDDESVVDASIFGEMTVDNNGFAISSNGGASIDAAKLQQKYVKANQLFDANWSPHFGAYAIIFDIS